MYSLARDRRAAALLAGVSVLTLAPLGAVAHADDAAPAAATSPDGGSGVGEIVVTGEKSVTTVQKAPISITAVSGDLLQERNLNQVNELNGYVPGLTIAKVRGSRTVVSIRGIGYETANNPNTQPGVAFHIDGVYIAHVTALSQDLLDVDHIEVLRGPQGTVFGQTSTGGAINVITKKPVLGEFSGQAAVSGGNHAYGKLNAGFNIPLGDTLALRVFGQYMRHDGYSVATKVPGYPGGYGLDDANNYGERASLLWQPSDRFSAELSFQAFDMKIHGFAQKDILDPDPDPDPRRVTQDFPAHYRLKTRMTYLTLTQDIGDFAVAKSTTAYQYLNKVQSAENDLLANPNYYDNLNFWQDWAKTFTQELTIQSKPGGAVDWTVGGFYLREHALQKIDERRTPPASNVPGYPDLSYATNSPYQHRSIAGFGQATWHATPSLDLIAGVRYSWDKTTAQPYNFYGAFGLVAPRQTTSSLVTGKLSADYTLSPGHKIYVIASRGYKPNGLNFNNSPLIVKTSFQKETIYAAEIGSKNQFLDNHLTFNVSGYYYWYNNFQFASEDPKPNQSGTENIPHARIYGLEFESSAVPTDHLRFDGTLSLTKGKFVGTFYTIDAQTASAVRSSYLPLSAYSPTVIAAVQASQFNTDGGRLPKLPGVQGQLSATYTNDIGPGHFTLRGEVVYRGKFSARIFDTAALDRVPAYTIFNAYIGYELPDTGLTFSVSANNVTNKAGVASVFTDPNGSLQSSREYIAPRQIFGTVEYKF